MFFPPRSVASPNPYVQHLPSGIEAPNLDHALKAMTQAFGEAKQSKHEDDLTESLFELEAADIRFYALGGELIAIHSSPKPRVQAFFRPCSGAAGRLTGTGSATGCLLFLSALVATAQARAFVSFSRLFPTASGVCTPCVCVPVGPFPSGTGIAPAAGILGVTVTASVTAQLLCI